MIASRVLRLRALAVPACVAALIGVASPSDAAAQASPLDIASAVTFVGEPKQSALLLFLEVQTHADGESVWDEAAEAAANDTRLARFDVARQVLSITGDAILLDRTIDQIVQRWQDEPSVLRYDRVWLVPAGEAGVVAREILLRQSLAARKVAVIAWYEPMAVLRPSRLGVADVVSDLTGVTRSDRSAKLYKYVEQQNERWLPRAGTTATSLHCANSTPAATSDMSQLGCRSASLVGEPTRPTTPGGPSGVVHWLARLVRLPEYSPTKAPLPPAVDTRVVKLLAPTVIPVDCNASTQAVPRLTLPADLEGRIVSAYALLDEIKNATGNASVRTIADREVLVTVALTGAPPDSLGGCTRTGEARVVAIVTVETRRDQP